MDAGITQIGAGVIFVHLLQWLKTTGWVPWFSASSDTLNKCLSAVASAAIAIGVQTHFEGSILSGGQIVISWPMMSSMVDLIFHAASQWAGSQSYYKLVVKPTA